MVLDRGEETVSVLVAIELNVIGNADVERVLRQVGAVEFSREVRVGHVVDDSTIGSGFVAWGQRRCGFRWFSCRGRCRGAGSCGLLAGSFVLLVVMNGTLGSWLLSCVSVVVVLLLYRRHVVVLVVVLGRSSDPLSASRRWWWGCLSLRRGLSYSLTVSLSDWSSRRCGFRSLILRNLRRH